MSGFRILPASQVQTISDALRDWDGLSKFFLDSNALQLTINLKEWQAVKYISRSRFSGVQTATLTRMSGSIKQKRKRQSPLPTSLFDKRPQP
jgi:hypothetical protein